MSTITTYVSDEVAHLEISGKVIHGQGASAAMQRAILRCSAAPFKLLVVNMRNVDAMDASGLSALVVAYHAAQSVGAEFCLEEVSPRLRDMLIITGLETVMLDRRLLTQLSPAVTQRP